MNKLMAGKSQISSRILWDSLSDVSAMKAWKTDLDRIIREGGDWSMVGQAVVIEADEEEIIKELVHHLAGAANMQLHMVPAHGVVESFPEWFDALPVNEPALVYLGAGEWHGEKFADLNPDAEKTNADPEKCREFIKAFKELIQTKLPARSVVLATTVKSFDQLDVSLRQAGIFDRRIQIPKLSDEAVFGVFAEEVGVEKLGASITNQVDKVSCLLRDVYPRSRRRRLMQQAMKRLAWRESRCLEYGDLVKFACYGTGDVDLIFHDASVRMRHAIHEAGHVVVGHVNSRNKTPAAYCSIVPRDEMHGIMVPAYESHERKSDDPSYKDMLYEVRVLLAGRAAEQLLLGSDELSAKGASSDLEKATELASSLFGLWGHSDDLSSLESAGKNLAVVVNDPTASELLHIETTVRSFLQKMYLETIEILKTNRDYLDAVISALTDCHYLTQEELQVIYDGVVA
jgi:Peptidase family M41